MIYIISHSDWDTYQPIYLDGPTVSNWDAYCNLFIEEAVDLLISQENRWIGWPEIAGAVADILCQRCGYKRIHITEKIFSGPSIIRGDSDDEEHVLPPDCMNKIRIHNDTYEKFLEQRINEINKQRNQS